MERPLLRRRWFRFSLRTLLVLVTLLCIYLAWAMNWIRQRDAFVNRTKVESGTLVVFRIAGIRDQFAPVSLRILNERGVDFVLVESMEEQELLTTSRLFPEAQILFCEVHKNGARYQTGLRSIYDLPIPRQPMDLPYYKNGVLFREEELDRVD